MESRFYLDTLIILLALGRCLCEQNFSSLHCVWNHHFAEIDIDGSNKCVPCSKCVAGFGEIRTCTRLNDTDCAPCQKGFFSPDGARHCRRCRLKCPRGQSIFRRCTPSKDTQCRPCKVGFYSSTSGKCNKCSVCPPGFYVWGLCDRRRNTMCRACHPGSYATGFGRRHYCRTCKDCESGVTTLMNCTTKHNSLCGDCQPGHFRIASSKECIKCAKCHREEAGYAVEIHRCREHFPDSDNICMPLYQKPYLHTDTYTDEFNDRLSKNKVVNETGSVDIQTSNIDTLSPYLLVLPALCLLLLSIVIIYKIRVYSLRIKSLKTSRIDKKYQTRQSDSKLCALPTKSRLCNSVPVFGSEIRFPSKQTSSCIEGGTDMELDILPTLRSQCFDDGKSDLSDNMLSVSATCFPVLKLPNIASNIPHQTKLPVHENTYSKQAVVTVENYESHATQLRNKSTSGTESFDSGSPSNVEDNTEGSENYSFEWSNTRREDEGSNDVFHNVQNANKIHAYSGYNCPLSDSDYGTFTCTHIGNSC